MNHVACIVLAAGMGKRMKSDLPKVLHMLNGRPLVAHVLDCCRRAGVGRIVVVVGYKGEMVVQVVTPYDVEIVWQTRQLGTGHAVVQTEPLLRNHPGEIVVLNGDVPLIRPETVAALVAEHRRRAAAATILTAEIENSTGYGRIVRNESGLVERVVEEADADDEIRRIREINSGIFCFVPMYLFAALHEVDNKNRQGEYYLPDTLTILRGDNHPIAAQKVDRPDEILGVNSLDQLKQMTRLAVRD